MLLTVSSWLTPITNAGYRLRATNILQLADSTHEYITLDGVCAVSKDGRIIGVQYREMTSEDVKRM